MHADHRNPQHSLCLYFFHATSTVERIYIDTITMGQKQSRIVSQQAPYMHCVMAHNIHSQFKLVCLRCVSVEISASTIQTGDCLMCLGGNVSIHNSNWWLHYVSFSKEQTCVAFKSRSVLHSKFICWAYNKQAWCWLCKPPANGRQWSVYCCYPHCQALADCHSKLAMFPTVQAFGAPWAGPRGVSKRVCRTKTWCQQHWKTGKSCTSTSPSWQQFDGHLSPGHIAQIEWQPLKLVTGTPARATTASSIASTSINLVTCPIVCIHKSYTAQWFKTDC